MFSRFFSKLQEIYAGSTLFYLFSSTVECFDVIFDYTQIVTYFFQYGRFRALKAFLSRKTKTTPTRNVTQKLLIFAKHSLCGNNRKLSKWKLHIVLHVYRTDT